MIPQELLQQMAMQQGPMPQGAMPMPQQPGIAPPPMPQQQGGLSEEDQIAMMLDEAGIPSNGPTPLGEPAEEEEKSGSGSEKKLKTLVSDIEAALGKLSS